MASTETPSPGESGTLLKRGLRAFEAGKFREAIESWEELLRSLGEGRAWKVLYNLGLAYERVGENLRAVERLEQFVRRVDTTSSTDHAELSERRTDAMERAMRLRKSLSVPTPSERSVVPAASASASRPLTPAPFVTAPSGFPSVWVAIGAGATAVSFLLPALLGSRATGKRNDALALGPTHPLYPGSVDAFESARRAYYYSYALPAALASVTFAILGYHLLRTPNARIGAGVLSEGRGGAVWASTTF